METNLLSQVKRVLSTFQEYWEDENLMKNKVIEDLRNYRKDLIEGLLSNDTIREAYSLNVNNGFVFKIDEFISMLRYKSYWENSYTKFSNDIGLTNDNKYLKYNTDVVLDFPHKDGVLEGGMSTEERGKREIYYHKVLAKDEIDLLLSPKTLTKIKKYTVDGCNEVVKIDDKDNLIIKGNNLIALHSLKSRLFGKVKLIYIVIHSLLKYCPLSIHRMILIG